jgi:hypothetical protein
MIMKNSTKKAFPVVNGTVWDTGMDLRDYTALKFANGYVGGSLDVIGHGMNFDMKRLVELSFEFADEFLKQREL